MPADPTLYFRRTEAFRRRFRAATAELGLSVQDVLFGLAEQWLDGDKETVQVEDRGDYGERRIHDNLEIILTQAEPRIADLLRGSVPVPKSRRRHGRTWRQLS